MGRSAWSSIGDRQLGGYATQPETWYLQLERRGVKYTGRASVDGKRWMDIGTHTIIKKNGRLGLGAYTWASGATEQAAELDDLLVTRPSGSTSQ